LPVNKPDKILKKMKEILVYVTNPAREKLYITYAAYLAKDLNLNIRFLHVQDLVNFPLGYPGILTASGNTTGEETERETEKAKHHFRLQIDNLHASEPDLPHMEYNIETGKAAEIIPDYCQSRSIDAIVLKGASEYSLFFSDSGNTDVIRKVRCPVWIIPEGITYKPFSEILYATDYHQEDLPRLKLLAGFASKFPAGITAVHITKDAGFRERIKGEGFARMIREKTGYDLVSVKILPRTKGEPLVEELHGFALMIDADLIVLLRENKGLWERLMHGSRSEKIARETQLPVLIYNEERR
jgi:nucleotide-binding universal stress UspA family protein